jgi:hypothetical protein
VAGSPAVADAQSSIASAIELDVFARLIMIGTAGFIGKRLCALF